MGYIFAYEKNSDEYESLGLCGALLPTSAEFSLQSGSYPELTINHPKDEIGKWKALKNGVVLRVSCPVRYAPDFKSATAYADTYQIWKIKTTATKEERKLKSKTNNAGKTVATAPGGATCTIVNVDLNHDYYKIKASWKVSGKNKTYTGWISEKALDYKISEATVANPDQTSGEAFASSYAIRDQLFRIYDVKLSDASGGQITVKARHIVYDLMGNVTTYSNNSGSLACIDACKGVLDNTVYPHDFNIYCDISSTRDGISYRNVNPIEAITKEDTGILTHWGAESVCDNYDIYVLRRAGTDRGYSLRYAQNITGVTYEIDETDAAFGIRCEGQNKNGSPLYINGRYENGKYIYNTSAELPSGYQFLRLPNGDIDGSVIVRNGTNASSIVVPKIYPNSVSEAKVDGKNVTEGLARVRLVDAAIKKFEDGCDDPKITLTVNFTLLGDTEEYKEYRHLDSLFVYDTVQVVHEPLGIDVKIDLKSLTWDCINDRVKTATFGSLQEISSSVASWNISSVNGSSIIPGSITAANLASGSINGVAIQDGAIAAQHVQANSINASAIQANAITSNHISSFAITSDKIAANSITAEKLDAGNVTAYLVETDQFKANVALAVNAGIENANISYAQIKDASVDTLFTKDANADKYYIAKLGATSAQIEALMVGQLVFKATDGKYYTLDASTDDDGNVSFAPTEYTGIVDENTGITSDGSRYVFSETVNTDDLYASSIQAADALITRLRVDQLFANSSFIGKLYTSNIYGGQSFQVIVGDISASAAAAESSASSAQSAAADAASAAAAAQSTADGAASTASAAQTAAQNASSVASQAKTAVDNIGIGGRNFIRNSDFSIYDSDSSSGYAYYNTWGNPTTREFVTDDNNKTWCHIVSSGNARWQGIQQRTSMLIHPLSNYRVSFRAKGGYEDQRVTVGIHWLNGSKDIINQSWSTAIIGTSEQTVEMQFSSDPDITVRYFNFMIGVDSNTTVYDVSFTDIMMENGTLTSSWRLADEDTNAIISNASNAAASADYKASGLEDDVKRMLRLDDNGLHVGDNQTTNEVLIDSESINIVMSGQKYSKFAGNYVQFGLYQLRKSADGGLVFKLKS